MPRALLTSLSPPRGADANRAFCAPHRYAHKKDGARGSGRVSEKDDVLGKRDGMGEKEDYWKFGKNTVLRLALSELLKGKKYLPEDIYIFDDTFSWTFVMTHEDLDGVPYCLKAEASEMEINCVDP